MAGQVDGFEIDVHLGVPDFLAQGSRVTGFGTANVVDEDIDAAVFGHAGVDERFHGGGRGRVGLHDDYGGRR